MRLRPAIITAACLLPAGCGRAGPPPGAVAGGGVPHTPRAVAVGSGPRFQPSPGAGQTSGSRCIPGRLTRYAVHVELFAAGHIVVVPAGIGEAPPLRRSGAYVHSLRCSYGLRTREPTGVVEVTTTAPVTLGDLFAVWGRALTRTRMLGFRGRVRTWVDGRRVAGDPGRIALRRHAQIVLVVGPSVPVHATYTFPPGL